MKEITKIQNFCINTTLNNFKSLSETVKYLIYYMVRLCIIKNIGKIELAAYYN